jgi:hypothetical protein
MDLGIGVALPRQDCRQKVINVAHVRHPKLLRYS